MSHKVTPAGMPGKNRHLSRRDFLAWGGAMLVFQGSVDQSLANQETDTPRHGISAFGDLKYPPDFQHFDYVNPDAPKGGTFNFLPPNWTFNQNAQTFNTLNSFVSKGDAPPRMELCFDSLMARALDEPDAVYGLLAQSITRSADGNSFLFELHPQARFHDGSPVTAEDVAFSYEAFREHGHPGLTIPLREMIGAEAVERHRFRLTFSGRQSSRVILTVAQFPILSANYYSGRSFQSSSLEAPLSSGPYRVAQIFAGQSIVYERVQDYWGQALAVNRGINNFERIRIDFYRERQAGFEAFKKGDVTYRQEFTSKTWAIEYDFPAIREKKVVKRTFPSDLRPVFQAWAINTRRQRFQDIRIRQAIGLCFDFEWTRENMFYGSYTRSDSLLENSEFKAHGTPDPDELELMDSLGVELPEAAFGEAVRQPVSDGSGRDRKLLREAVMLIRAAGWKRRDGIFVNETGEPLSLEILVRSPVFVRVDTPFVENMRAVGIDASIRLVDPAQYQSRVLDFDFDMVGIAASISATPTREDLANYFHSQSASTAGSRNLPGTADPAVDRLIDEIGQADSRKKLVTVLRVLDRVMRARQDWIPNWHAANHRAAYWDMFGFIEPKPDFGFPAERLWWIDQEKARALGKN